MNPALLGFCRAIGVVVLSSVLAYIGDAAHLNGIVDGVLATIISGAALALEHSIEQSSGNALFGAVKTR